jgi:hypothetical protein
MATKLGLDTHNQSVTTGIGAELGGIVANGTAWIEALRSKLRLTAVTSTDGWARTWASRAIAAAVRAFLVMILIVAPSVILPGIGADTKQIVALLSLFGGALVFFEYNAVYPSLIEFRDGAPYNRIRYLMMLTIVVVLSSIVADLEASTTVSRFFHALGLLIGASLDFPYSPVRLASYMLDDTATAAQIVQVKVAAGTAYLISLFSLALFVIVLKLVGWPSTKAAFNVWVNLPTFEPTAGGDVVDRLVRDPGRRRSADLRYSGGYADLAADADLDHGALGLHAGGPDHAGGRHGADRRHDPHQAGSEAGCAGRDRALAAGSRRRRGRRSLDGSSC